MAETPKTTPNPSGGRRTRAPRFPAGLPAAIRAGDGDGGSRACRLVDLSRSGALLSRAPTVPRGRTLELGLQSAGGDLDVRVSAEVARSDRRDGEPCLGVRFVAVTDGQRRALESLLARVIEGRAPGALAELTGDEKPARVREVLARIPVTHRVSLAARADVGERKLLFHDDDPRVQTALMRNPLLRLEEVVAFLARPTTASTALDVIARDPRWSSHADLRVRLASHPRVTLTTATRVAATLSPTARQRLLRRPGLHPSIRARLLKK